MSLASDVSAPSSPGAGPTISSLVLGGAGFSYQLNPKPETSPVREIISRAFELGITTIDTSPYYEPSEKLMGAAINQLQFAAKWPRDSYTLMTKVGRITEDQFDYSPAWIKKSVSRSLDRFQTSYLDVVFCHDVEFVTIDEAIEAVAVLFELADMGQIKYVGISGYKIEILVEIARRVRSTYGRPVNIVQTWAQLTLQNTKLLSKGLQALEDAGVGTVCASSPLAVGLLRDGGVPIGTQGDWHPAPAGLRKAAQQASTWTAERGHPLSAVALRFAVLTALQNSRPSLMISTVMGVSTMSELEENARHALQILQLESYFDPMSHTQMSEPTNVGYSPTEDEMLFNGVRKILGSWLEYDLVH